LLFLIYWFLLRTKPSEIQDEKTALPPPVALTPGNNQSTTPPPPVEGEEKVKADLNRLAAAFAERFGSYSNQGEYANLLDLKPIMTNAMQKWADEYIAKSKAENANISIYSGVTTRAVSVKITSLNDKNGTAKAVVNTQREKTGGVREIYYQNLELEFQKIKNEWKVDKAKWME
jgi:hypothetical protein